jgi:hypothetical protein
VLLFFNENKPARNKELQIIYSRVVALPWSFYALNALFRLWNILYDTEVALLRKETLSLLKLLSDVIYSKHKTVEYLINKYIVALLLTPGTKPGCCLKKSIKALLNNLL